MSISNWLDKIRYRPLRIWKREAKHFWQRTARGWDDSETWSLDHSLAKMILPRLQRFKEINVAVPVGMTQREWNTILDQMIATFEFAGSEKRWHMSDSELDKHQEGIDLFAKYYFHLWW